MPKKAQYSHHVFTISDLSTHSQNYRNGCWMCRFRRKRCTPGPNGKCLDCHKFNMRCLGQGFDRPSGKQLAEDVRAETKAWIKDRTNYHPSVAPLDLSYLWTPLLPSPASSSSATSPEALTPDLDSDDTSMSIDPSLFPAPGTDSCEVQEIDITHPSSPYTLDVQAETQAWINDCTKHHPSHPSLDFSCLWTLPLHFPSSSSTATSSGTLTPDLDSDDTSISIVPSLFPAPGIDSYQVQEIDITHPGSPYTLDEAPSNQPGTASPIIDWWAAEAARNATTPIPPNHSEFLPHTQFPSPSTYTYIPTEADSSVAHDHYRGIDAPFFSPSFPLSVYDSTNVPQATLDQYEYGASSGSEFHPCGGVNAVTSDQPFPHLDFRGELGSPWTPPPTPR